LLKLLILLDIGIQPLFFQTYRGKSRASLRTGYFMPADPGKKDQARQ